MNHRCVPLVENRKDAGYRTQVKSAWNSSCLCLIYAPLCHRSDVCAMSDSSAKTKTYPFRSGSCTRPLHENLDTCDTEYNEFVYVCAQSTIVRWIRLIFILGTVTDVDVTSSFIICNAIGSSIDLHRHLKTVQESLAGQQIPSSHSRQHASLRPIGVFFGNITPLCDQSDARA